MQILDVFGSQNAFMDSDVLSLEDRLTQKINQSNVDFGTEKDDILAKLGALDAMKEPGGMFDLQVRTSDYNLAVSLASTLTRKTVSAVETLLR